MVKFYRLNATGSHLVFQRLHLLCPFTLFGFYISRWNKDDWICRTDPPHGRLGRETVQQIWLFFCFKYLVQNTVDIPVIGTLYDLCFLLIFPAYGFLHNIGVLEYFVPFNACFHILRDYIYKVACLGQV